MYACMCTFFIKTAATLVQVAFSMRSKCERRHCGQAEQERSLLLFGAAHHLLVKVGTTTYYKQIII